MKRLLRWGGDMEGVTVGAVYFTHDDYPDCFQDDFGNARAYTHGDWEEFVDGPNNLLRSTQGALVATTT